MGEETSSKSQPQVAAVVLQVPSHPVAWTYGIIAANGLAFLGSVLLGRDLVILLGAKINQLIVSGEWWRLLTAIFLHADFLHIAFNSYALYTFGTRLESIYGQGRFLALYLLSGVAGSALSFALSPRAAVGASGAIFGVIGGLATYYYRYRKQLSAGSGPLANVVIVMLYNLFYGFIVPGIDNWGHLGGLLAGTVLGWFFIPEYQVVFFPESLSPVLVDAGRPMRRWTGVALVGIGIAAACLGGMLRWRG
ncbi:MAG: rhomboid family intramembrane serine protease [Anaerolineae bacterium]|nr:rhomboid family intramembrane serine protease [Anaerolineae bacterium]